MGAKLRDLCESGIIIGNNACEQSSPRLPASKKPLVVDIILTPLWKECFQGGIWADLYEKSVVATNGSNPYRCSCKIYMFGAFFF